MAEAGLDGVLESGSLDEDIETSEDTLLGVCGKTIVARWKFNRLDA